MQKITGITCLFLDTGGVLLTNAWGNESRRKAADVFNRNFSDIDVRHHLNQVTYEEGKLTLGEYLTHVIFYEKAISRLIISGNLCSAMAMTKGDVARGLVMRRGLHCSQ